MLYLYYTRSLCYALPLRQSKSSDPLTTHPARIHTNRIIKLGVIWVVGCLQCSHDINKYSNEQKLKGKLGVGGKMCMDAPHHSTTFYNPIKKHRTPMFLSDEKKVKFYLASICAMKNEFSAILNICSWMNLAELKNRVSAYGCGKNSRCLANG